MRARLRGRAPRNIGSEQITLPCPTVRLPPREVVSLPDEQAFFALARWGRAGLVEVEETPGKTPEEQVNAALLKGIAARHKSLVRHIQRYRLQARQAIAAGREPRLPEERERQMLLEVKALRAEMQALDPVLNASDIPEINPAEAEDVVGKDLEAFGIPASAARSIPALGDAPF